MGANTQGEPVRDPLSVVDGLGEGASGDAETVPGVWASGGQDKASVPDGVIPIRVARIKGCVLGLPGLGTRGKGDGNRRALSCPRGGS